MKNPVTTSRIGTMALILTHLSPCCWLSLKCQHSKKKKRNENHSFINENSFPSLRLCKRELPTLHFPTFKNLKIHIKEKRIVGIEISNKENKKLNVWKRYLVCAINNVKIQLIRLFWICSPLSCKLVKHILTQALAILNLRKIQYILIKSCDYCIQ